MAYKREELRDGEPVVDDLSPVALRLRERYTFVSPCDEDWYSTWLKVGGQSFRVAHVEATREEAEWSRDMLAKALEAILEASWRSRGSTA